MLTRIKRKLLCDKSGKPAPKPPANQKPDVNNNGNGPTTSTSTSTPAAAPALDVPGIEDSSKPLVPSELESSQEPKHSARDLWAEARESLPAKTLQKLREMGLGEVSSGSMRSNIDELVGVAKDRQEECEKKFWRLPVGDEDIVLRDYTSKIVKILQQTGDFAIQFAPPQASLPWSVLKSFMQISVIEDEQMGALLASVEKVVTIINRGQVYEVVYTPKTTPDDALKNFYTTLCKLYAAALALLAEAGSLFSASTAKRTIHALFKPGEATGILAELATQESQLTLEVQACESRRSELADRRLMDSLQALDAPLTRVDENVSGLLETVAEKDRIELLEWISRIRYGKNHNLVKEKRTPDTGDWLIQHQKFRHWEDSSSSVTFWLQGAPGTGKSVLTSKVIDHTLSVLEGNPNDEGLAFFYCDKKDKPRTLLLSILQSYVRQLSTPVRHPGSMRSKLREACVSAKNEGSDLSLYVCQEQLLDSLNLYPKTTLVLDALDECDPITRADIVDTLNLLVSQSERPVKIFISSRPDPDLEGLLADSTTMRIEANDNKDDIERFLDKEVQKLVRRYHRLDSLKNNIKDTLLARCQGMFQWVALQIQRLAGCSTREAVEHSLQSLPNDLKATYDVIYGEIEALEPNEKALVDRALLWVMSASTPLRSDELLPAIRAEFRGDSLNLSSELDESILLSLCKNLLVIDSQLHVWRFPHLSVADYLEHRGGFSLQEAHSHSANVCLSLLSTAYGKWDPDDQPDQPTQHDGIFDVTKPIQIYARHHWMLHVPGAADTDHALATNLKGFLGSPNKSSIVYQRWQHHVAKEARGFSSPSSSFVYSLHVDAEKGLDPAESALPAMCQFSFSAILGDWWANAEIDRSLINGNGDNLLAQAAVAGSKPICKSLVDRGFNIEIPNFHTYYGNSLTAAAYAGQLETVQFLIQDAGAIVNKKLRIGTHGSTLVAAVAQGHMKVVKFLVNQADADVNMLVPEGDYTSALGAAAYEGYLDIVKFLVTEGGADVNIRQMTDRDPLFEAVDRLWDSVLAMAASRGHYEIVKFLVRDAGADANMAHEGKQGGSPLVAAVQAGNTDILKLLVQDGKADVSMRTTGHFANALTQAAAWGRLDAVRYLIEEAGADINEPVETGSHGSALAAAANFGKLDMVKYLVEQAGADVNQQLPNPASGGGGSALLAAVSAGHLDIVKYLVEEGHAEVNMQLPPGLFTSALAAATMASPRMEIVRYLVEEVGADVNLPLQNGRFGSAVICTVNMAGGETDFLSYLVSHGASLTTQQGDYGSALASAAAGDEPDIMKWLVEEAHVDVNEKVVGGKFGSALAAAAYWGGEDAVQFLLDAGADVNLVLEGKSIGNALQATTAAISEADREQLAAMRVDEHFLTLRRQMVAELLRENGAI
ncbi:ankyrin repeat-containing domain protein [Aspergillus californicus]